MEKITHKKSLVQKISKLFFETVLMGTMLFLVLNIHIAYAQSPPPIIPENSTPGGILFLPHTKDSASEGQFLQEKLLPSITATIITITGGVSLLFAIVGGVLMLTSYGNPDNFAKGKNALIYALVGIVIGALSYAIVAIISSIQIKAPIK